MATLWIDGLCKKYPAFYLDHVTFEVGEGKIMGFVGRNGAGKTTTIKSLFNYVHPDEGDIYFFGLNFAGNELEIKSRVGYVGSDGGFYAQKRLGKLTEVTKTFYPDWDDAVYRDCLRRFNLDESKRIRELSEGMKVKYQLALALSHHAQLLVLDEPTSGLDPVSRDDLLELFLDLAEKEKVSILFSTHITSDLEKCADDVTYIQNGRIVYTGPRKALPEEYVLLTGEAAKLTEPELGRLIGYRAHHGEFTAMIPREALDDFKAFTVTEPTLEDVMVHLERT
jgi:ABC-2 type transport system ATP-binding protein